LGNLDHTVFGDSRSGFKAFGFCQSMQAPADERTTPVTWNAPFPHDKPAWLAAEMARLAPTDHDMKKYIRQVLGPHTLGVTVKVPVAGMKIPR
jgi:hypothetical protein